MHPTRKQIAEALAEVTNPEAHSGSPAEIARMRTAWALLKEARGQSVDFQRMGDPSYQIVPDTAAPEPADAEAESARPHFPTFAFWRGGHGGDAA
ncbi:hypothetical protein SAMN04490248_1841 [Salinihabitans flavidus]|uniref:Uncharacterized protein n=1 Tax=Salinihabitans flavidus TaxID=569882 RepID=A0A1H8WM83_9RHOB|nr:hypothetical protein [Salinihabitans flavidus]SEP28736.1 hypothetical protein SAMN04490248_1841 [Salinihabitans flavidus]